MKAEMGRGTENCENCVLELKDELSNKRELLKILQEQFDQAIEQRNVALDEAQVLREERDNALRIGTEYRKAAEKLQTRLEVVENSMRVTP